MGFRADNLGRDVGTGGATASPGLYRMGGTFFACMVARAEPLGIFAEACHLHGFTVIRGT